MKNYPLAEKYMRSSFIMAQELESAEDLMLEHKHLSELFEQTNRLGEALSHYKLFKQLQDSILNKANTKKIVQQQMQFDFDKKQAADSVKLADERKMNEMKFTQEKNRRYILYSGLAIVILFSGFLYNRFKITQRQKKVIEKQKREVEENRKEIIDSIRYAKRIQNSLMPSDRYIERTIERLGKNKKG